mgnify:CR=1 FL=1
MQTTETLRDEIAELVSKYSKLQYAEKIFVPGETPVPVSGKVIGETELQYMVEASLDGWLTTGRFNDKFEKELAAFIGIKHLITVNSGSSANLVAFSTLTSQKLGDRAIKKGDGSISGVIAHPSADGSALAAASSITATSEGGWTRVPSLKRYSIIDASTFLSR